MRPLVERLTDSLGPALVLPTGQGRRGWRSGLAAYDGDGYKLGTVFYGGDRTDVLVEATSGVADVLRESITAHGGKTARVDTRVDSLVAFEDLAGILEEASMTYGSVIHEHASRVRGESTGRTVYLGAPSSAIRVRLYEKWLESPGQYVEGTNRIEVQLRPPSRVKEKVSGWSRAETFCASKVARDVAQMLGTDVADPGTLQKKRGTPDLERTLAAMGEQYGKGVKKWLRLSGGDVGRVLDHLTGTV